MEAGNPTAAKPGLRERKKQRTRETIVREALKLFAERGYDRTTLAEIAEAADVSTRTIFSYFDCKEDILFCEEPALHELLEHRLQTRPPGVTTIDAIRAFVAELGPPDESAVLRKHIIASNEALRLSERAREASIEEVIAESFAKDLNAAPDDIRPPLIAASMAAAFKTMSDRLKAESGHPASHEEIQGIVDEVLEFVRGGLEALQRPAGDAGSADNPGSAGDP